MICPGDAYDSRHHEVDRSPDAAAGTHDRTIEIHRTARLLVRHHKQGELHPIDFQRYRETLWGDPLDRRSSNEDLIRSAYVSVGETPPARELPHDPHSCAQCAEAEYR